MDFHFLFGCMLVLKLRWGQWPIYDRCWFGNFSRSYKSYFFCNVPRCVARTLLFNVQFFYETKEQFLFVFSVYCLAEKPYYTASSADQEASASAESYICNTLRSPIWLHESCLVRIDRKIRRASSLIHALHDGAGQIGLVGGGEEGIYFYMHVRLSDETKWLLVWAAVRLCCKSTT